MHRCFQLAEAGLGNTAPNPLVGAVVVHGGRIIGEGYHRKYGEAHAEVNAIESVVDKGVLKESTLYVNLEPCAHQGKTPPCADLIVKMGIPNVVIANRDPFTEVNGKGIERMKSAGIKVDVGIAHDEGRMLNRRFFTFHEEKRPYIMLKWAQSKDGFIDMKRSAEQKGSFWITAPQTRKLVHLWRSQECAILVGANTIINDDPQLNVREVAGNSPRIVILDPDRKAGASSKVFKGEPLHYITNSSGGTETTGNEGFQGICLSQDNFLNGVLNDLYLRGIQSVMVEGGAFTLQRFIEAELWDEARVLTGTMTMKDGLQAPAVKGSLTRSFYYGSDKVDIIHRT